LLLLLILWPKIYIIAKHQQHPVLALLLHPYNFLCCLFLQSSEISFKIVTEQTPATDSASWLEFQCRINKVCDVTSHCGVVTCRGATETISLARSHPRLLVSLDGNREAAQKSASAVGERPHVIFTVAECFAMQL
jgi:hypothetical protein